MLRLFSCLKTKEEYMELTPRLAAVAALVPACHCMADIGTDHAYVPMNLVKKHRAAHAVASDIHKGPLEIARKHIGENGLSRWIETRLGGGLETLQPGECEGVVIAGMGGLMICDILANSPKTAGALSWAVLQPMNHSADLRIWLAEHGWKITQEKLAREDWHIYDILYVEHGDMPVPSPLDAELGVTPMRREDSLFPELVKKLIKQRNAVLQGIPEDTENVYHKEKREKAAAELKILEDIICRLKPEK